MVKPVNINFGCRKTSIFYINDVHGQTEHMPQILEAAQEFDKFTPSGQVDKLKLASGDTILGSTKEFNMIAAQFLDFLGIEATAIGNHEFDCGVQRLYELTKDKKYKMLGLNIKIDKDYPLSKRVERFSILEKNGTKYGIIGLSPTDLLKRIANNGDKNLEIENMDRTIKDVQKVIDKLHALGIDKIIVVSHLGNDSEKRLAQETAGIDVILGGHSHELITGVKKGENLLHGKDGKPVVITQAGKDGNHYGILNLEFDDKGNIVKAENKVISIQKHKENSIMKKLLDKILGKPEIIGIINSTSDEPQNRLLAENPTASFVADAIKAQTGADIVLMTAGCVRGNFKTGELNSREIANILPFKANVIKTEISEQELIEALKLGATSLKATNSKPGLLQVAGLNYEVSKEGKLISAYTIDTNGKKHTINIDNPSKTKTYSVGMDTYLALGSDGFTMLDCKDKPQQTFKSNKNKMVIDYIKFLTVKNGSIDIKTDNRIKIV